MSEVKVNKISPRTNCGTVTLGDSGDTFTIPSGVTITNNGTQTGFGREGSVDWQTTIKTADFTAASGEGYFINTTSGAITMTLPSSPSAGDIVAIKDYANTFDTNNLTINRNGQPLSGDAENAIISTEGQSLTLVYGDSTKGWQGVAAATEADLPKPQYIVATGGTITTVCTNFKVHTFTGPGTFQVTNAGSASGSNEISYLVVGGGGSAQDGGAGAGGFREGKSPQTPYTSSPLACTSGSNNGLPVAVASYPVTVGAGAAYAPGPGPARCGSNSSFAGTTTITSAGGGFGATNDNGNAGGSGGSGGANRGGPGGAGNTPPVNPPQGSNGGASSGPSSGAGGGGGATAVGGNWPGPRLGGTGATTNITGSATAYAGGGSGAAPAASSVARSPCGTGGAGISGAQSAPGTQCGVVNTGGGGGGVWNGTNGAGGSGVVIIRYKFQ
tara:strand:+ start:970 stop:2298 length:1329 start_codon:yes stop_codon:yes gene_type:complete